MGIWEKCKHIKQKGWDNDERKMILMSTDPSQGLERAAEIRKPGVRFPVEVRICFGVKMRWRWFAWVTVGWIKRIKIKTRKGTTRLMRVTRKMFGMMLKRWKGVWFWWAKFWKITRWQGSNWKWIGIFCPIKRRPAHFLRLTRRWWWLCSLNWGVKMRAGGCLRGDRSTQLSGLNSTVAYISWGNYRVVGLKGSRCEQLRLAGWGALAFIMTWR